MGGTFGKILKGLEAWGYFVARESMSIATGAFGGLGGGPEGAILGGITGGLSGLYSNGRTLIHQIEGIGKEHGPDSVAKHLSGGDAREIMRAIALTGSPEEKSQLESMLKAIQSGRNWRSAIQPAHQFASVPSEVNSLANRTSAHTGVSPITGMALGNQTLRNALAQSGSKAAIHRNTIQNYVLGASLPISQAAYSAAHGSGVESTSVLE